MTANELKIALNSIPPHIEIVVGDPDVNLYYEPVPTAARYLRLWKLVQENPSGGPSYITYFADKIKGEREQLTTSLVTLAFHEVDCLRI
jgi:hypothetical protein